MEKKISSLNFFLKLKRIGNAINLPYFENMIELGCSQSLVVEPFHDAHKNSIRSLYVDLLYFPRL